MRREKRRRMETDEGLIITSMVDMFTLLLTFLLNFVQPSEAGGAELLLPDSRAQAELRDGPRLVVSATDVRVGEQVVLRLADGPRVPGDAPRSAEGGILAVESALREARAAAEAAADAPAGGGEGPALVVLCHKSVPYAVVTELLATARLAGFGRFRFVVDGAPG